MFKSRKIYEDIKICEPKPAIISQQCVVYNYKCDLCDAEYVGYTSRHLHQRIDEHRYSAIGKHLSGQQFTSAYSGRSWCFFCYLSNFLHASLLHSPRRSDHCKANPMLFQRFQSFQRVQSFLLFTALFLFLDIRKWMILIHYFIYIIPCSIVHHTHTVLESTLLIACS